MSRPPLFLGWLEEQTDPHDWSDSTLSNPLTLLDDKGFKTALLTVAPLKAGWATELPQTWYRSGAGPLEALRDAAGAVESGEFDAVLVRGEEPLRTGYTREERHRLMNIYPEASIPEAYELLARAFCERQGWSSADFLAVAEALWANYQKTVCAEDPADAKWLCPLTPLQRGVDCANPLIDWRGQALVMNARAAEVAGDVSARIAGAAFEKLGVDGPDHVERIARFDHLERTVAEAESLAGVKIAELARSEKLAMELYTCYPVIPAAFMVASNIARTPGEIAAFLSVRPVTLTGGMNLARAPWNLPALRALVRVGRAVGAGESPWGLVHGNGGVGYAQGVAILTRP